jgi:hypothetical protein
LSLELWNLCCIVDEGAGVSASQNAEQNVVLIVVSRAVGPAVICYEREFASSIQLSVSVRFIRSESHFVSGAVER